MTISSPRFKDVVNNLFKRRRSGTWIQIMNELLDYTIFPKVNNPNQCINIESVLLGFPFNNLKPN